MENTVWVAQDVNKACKNDNDYTCNGDMFECVEKATKRLGELEDKIEKGELVEQKQGEWISVEDRLPETDHKNTFDYNVLVYIPQRKGCRQSGIYLGKVRKVEGDDGKGNFWGKKTEPCEWTVWGWSYFEHPVVTHWMPLPQPPKMKGAENG